jgi:hypothetical protein
MLSCGDAPPAMEDDVDDVAHARSSSAPAAGRTDMVRAAECADQRRFEVASSEFTWGAGFGGRENVRSCGNAPLASTSGR